MHDQRFLGVRHYEPDHVESVGAVSADHRRRLRGLRGGRLVRSWAVWETRDDEWFVDAPVVLDFGATRLEIAAFKTYLCLSWDSIDVRDGIEWHGTDFRLEWRPDMLAPLNSLLHRDITDVALIDYRGELNGIALTAAGSYAELFNGLDELRVRDVPDRDADVTTVQP